MKDKSIRLLLPGIVFSLVAFAVKIAFLGEMARQTRFGLKELLMAFVYPYDNPFREMWFLITLFIFFLLTPIWQEALKKGWSKWGLLVILIALHFIQPESKLFSIDRVCNQAVWFYSGVLLSKGKYIEERIVKYPWLTMIMGVVIYVIGYYTNSFVTTIGGITFSFGFALLADKYWPMLLFTFRNYTYQIFLMGIFAQIIIKILYRHYPMPYVLAYLVCIIAGIYVPVLVSKIIEKININPLSLCVGLKTK
jgi:hypothetical protein